MSKHRRKPPVIIVSGAPRCGTTLMMRQLQAGGAPVLVESSTHAENGLARRGDITRATMRRLGGRACKILEVGLRNPLPPRVSYRVIWMVRDPVAQAASIDKYAVRQGAAPATAEQLERIRRYVIACSQHGLWYLQRIGATVRRQGYEHMLADPLHQCEQIAAWLRPHFDLDPVAMAALVDTGRDGSCSDEMFSREVAMARAAGEELGDRESAVVFGDLAEVAPGAGEP